MKTLGVHLGLLGVAGALALWVYEGGAQVDTTKAQQVELWDGQPEAIESIVYDTKLRDVNVQPRKDDQGRWFVVRVDREAPAAPPHVPGHGAPPPPPPAAGKRDKLAFVGVKEVEALTKKLAPLMATRAVGKVDAKRAADYGLDKPEGTLKVKIGGKERVLTFGAQAPGGGERYAKYAASGEVFAIDNDIFQALQLADSRLMERGLHGFDFQDVSRITVSRAGKSRTAVRVPEKRDAWADAASPAKLDETLGNWISKLDRLHVNEYVEKPVTLPRPEDLVVRVEYFTASKSVGFLELFKIPGAEKGSEYLARTEQSRWFTQVLSSAAEQVDQDLGALLK